MAKGKSKGSAFEREICQKLSIWWSSKNDDDLFWRSAGSGSRATMRGRKGKQTKGQGGDIVATDGRGAAFLRFFSVELKRGYNHVCPFDFIDKPSKKSEFAEWVKQATQSARDAHVPNWLLIHKRDRHEAVVYWCRSLKFRADDDINIALNDLPKRVMIPFNGVMLCGCRLSDLLASAITPNKIRSVL